MAPKKDDEQPATRKKRAQEIPWAKRPELTDALVAYFIDHPQFRRAYWSDSVESARSEDRTKKVNHDSKTFMNKTLADHIFLQHPDFMADYKTDAKSEKRYAISTSNRLTRLKEQYKEHAEALGSTGLGLKREDVVEGSNIHNMHQEILKTFPWWYELDSMWHELPNFVPVAVSGADPGADHASAAKSLFASTGADDDGLGSEEEDEILNDPKANVDDDEGSVGTPVDAAGPGRSSSTPIGSPAQTRGSPSREVSLTPSDPTDTRRPAAATTSGAAGGQSRPHVHSRSSSTSAASKSTPAPSAAAKAPAAARPPAKPPAKKKDKDAMASLKRMREADTSRQEQKDKQVHDQQLAKLEAAVGIKKRKYDLRQMKLEAKAKEAERQREHEREKMRDMQRLREFELARLQMQLQLQHSTGGMGSMGGMGGFGGTGMGGGMGNFGAGNFGAGNFGGGGFGLGNGAGGAAGGAAAGGGAEGHGAGLGDAFNGGLDAGPMDF